MLGYSLSHNGKSSAGRNELPFTNSINPNELTNAEYLNFDNINATDIMEAQQFQTDVSQEKLLKRVVTGHLNYRGPLMTEAFNIINMY